jgi:hypothetical protein
MDRKDGFLIDVLTRIIRDICLLNKEGGLAKKHYEETMERLSDSVAIASYLLADSMQRHIEDGSFDLEVMNDAVQRIREMGL